MNPSPTAHPAASIPAQPQAASAADPLILYGQHFSSRLMLGTSRYPSPALLQIGRAHV